jgi:hypothetical protein
MTLRPSFGARSAQLRILLAPFSLVRSLSLAITLIVVALHAVAAAYISLADMPVFARLAGEVPL